MLKQLGSGKKSGRERVTKFFTIHVHTLQPWPSHLDKGKALELQWKLDKHHGRLRAIGSSRVGNDKRRKLGSNCKFDQSFEVKGKLIQYPDGSYEKKAIVFKIFEVDVSVSSLHIGAVSLPSSGSNKVRPNLGTLVLDLSTFTSVPHGKIRRRYSVSVPKSVSGAIGKPFADITVCIHNTRGSFIDFDFDSIPCEPYIESDDDLDYDNETTLIDELMRSHSNDGLLGPPARKNSFGSGIGNFFKSKSNSAESPRSSSMNSSPRSSSMGRDEKSGTGNLNSTIAGTDGDADLLSGVGSRSAKLPKGALHRSISNTTLDYVEISRSQSAEYNRRKSDGGLNDSRSMPRGSKLDPEEAGMKTTIKTNVPKSGDLDFKEQLLRDHLSVRTTKDKNVPSYRRGSNTYDGRVSVARGVQTDADMYISGSGLHESRQQRMRADTLEEQVEQLQIKLSTYTNELRDATALEIAILRPNAGADKCTSSLIQQLTPASLLTRTAFSITSGGKDGKGKALSSSKERFVSDIRNHQIPSFLSFQDKMLHSLRIAVSACGTSIAKLSSWWINIIVLQSWLPPAYDRRELCEVEELVFQNIVSAAWKGHAVPAMQGVPDQSQMSKTPPVHRWRKVFDDIHHEITSLKIETVFDEDKIISDIENALSFLSAQILTQMCCEIDSALFYFLVLGTDCLAHEDLSPFKDNKDDTILREQRKGLRNEISEKSRFNKYGQHHVSDVHYSCLPVNGPLTFEAGMAIKVAVQLLCDGFDEKLRHHMLRFLVKRKRKTTHVKSSDSISHNEMPDLQTRNGAATEVSVTFNLFPCLSSLSNVLLLPKDSLIDPAMRREVCPTFSSKTLREILIRYVPNPKAQGPSGSIVSDVLISRLNSAIIAEKSLSESTSNLQSSTASSTPSWKGSEHHVLDILLDSTVAKIPYKSKSATDLMPYIGVTDRWRFADMNVPTKLYENALEMEQREYDGFCLLKSAWDTVEYNYQDNNCGATTKDFSSVHMQQSLSGFRAINESHAADGNMDSEPSSETNIKLSGDDGYADGDLQILEHLSGSQSPTKKQSTLTHSLSATRTSSPNSSSARSPSSSPLRKSNSFSPGMPGQNSENDALSNKESSSSVMTQNDNNLWTGNIDYNMSTGGDESGGKSSPRTPKGDAMNPLVLPPKVRTRQNSEFMMDI